MFRKKNAWAFITALLIGGAASAEILEGEFFDAGNKSTIYVKSNGTGDHQVTYGIVRQSQGTGIFLVEENADGSTSWVQLFQSKDFVLSTGKGNFPTYSGTIERSGQKKTTLRLVATALGQKLNCPGQIDAEWSADFDWGSAPKETVHYIDDGGHADELTWSPDKQALTGKLWNGDRLLSGSFHVDEKAPGLGVVRAQELDPESITGRSLQREITAVVLFPYRKDGGFRRLLRLVRLRPGEAACFSSTSLLGEGKK